MHNWFSLGMMNNDTRCTLKLHPVALPSVHGLQRAGGHQPRAGPLPGVRRPLRLRQRPDVLAGAGVPVPPARPDPHQPAVPAGARPEEGRRQARGRGRPLALHLHHLPHTTRPGRLFGRLKRASFDVYVYRYGGTDSLGKTVSLMFSKGD